MPSEKFPRAPMWCALSLALSLGLTAIDADAAGLGRLSVQSGLGQPLRAELEVTSVGREEAPTLQVKLAPLSAFRAANLEFNPALTNIRFALDRRQDGTYLVRISSAQAVNEPYLDMKPYDLPDQRGHFGPYGGIFVAETLMHALEELRDAYAHYQNDPEFVAEFHKELKHYVGRPSPIYHAKRWSDELGGAQIYLKREDLNHTGAHKVNNTIGQALLAKRMGKPRVIAETGAGQHGVATATVAARYGMLRDVAAAHGYTYSISAHESVGAAYAAARECAAPDDRILAFGSFLAVADVLRVLRVGASAG